MEKDISAILLNEFINLDTAIERAKNLINMKILVNTIILATRLTEEEFNRIK